MSNVFTTDSENSLIIYHYKQYIYLRSATGETLNRSILLSNDFHSNLTEAIYNNTLYYAYQNEQGDILIKSILDSKPLYQLLAGEVGECITPQIISWRGKLLLIYILKNPLNDTYLCKGILPFEDISSSESLVPIEVGLFQSLPVVKTVSTKNKLFFIVDDGNTHHASLVGDDFTLHPCEDRSKYDALLQSQEEKMRNLQASLQQKEALIAHIKKQYEELMDTAKKYREEAQKWYEKFSGTQ